jgi:RNA polymerase sigma-70 factor (ECF subfamily)
MDQEKLVAALRSRDPGAIQELVETHGDRLLRSACLLCGNETDAQDIVQDTFLEAIKSVHRFRGRSTLYTWLHSILLNLTRHYRRDRKRVIYDNELAGREIASSDDNPNRLDVESASTALADALRRLSAPHREVLILRYFEHMKIHEMARHLGISRGTVKSRLHYAIQEMQRLLPDELNLFGAGGTKEAEKR